MNKSELQAKLSTLEKQVANAPANARPLMQSAIEKIKGQIQELEGSEAKPSAPEKTTTARGKGRPKGTTKPKKEVEKKGRGRPKKEVTPEVKPITETQINKVAKDIREEGEPMIRARKRAKKALVEIKDVAKDTAKMESKGKLTKAKIMAEIKKLNKVFANLGIDIQVDSADDLFRDASRTALPKGWRTSKNGKEYYENRPNRSDSLQNTPVYSKLKLAEGGMIKEGDKVQAKKNNNEVVNGIVKYIVPENDLIFIEIIGKDGEKELYAQKKQLVKKLAEVGMENRKVRIIKDVNFDGYYKIVDVNSDMKVLEDNIRGLNNAIKLAEDRGYIIASVHRINDEYEDGKRWYGYAEGGMMDDELQTTIFDTKRKRFRQEQNDKLLGSNKQKIKELQDYLEKEYDIDITILGSRYNPLKTQLIDGKIIFVPKRRKEIFEEKNLYKKFALYKAIKEDIKEKFGFDSFVSGRSIEVIIFDEKKIVNPEIIESATMSDGKVIALVKTKDVYDKSEDAYHLTLDGESVKRAFSDLEWAKRMFANLVKDYEERIENSKKRDLEREEAKRQRERNFGFEKGEKVQATTGKFKNKIGVVDEVYPEAKMIFVKYSHRDGTKDIVFYPKESLKKYVEKWAEGGMMSGGVSDYELNDWFDSLPESSQLLYMDADTYEEAEEIWGDMDYDDKLDLYYSYGGGEEEEYDEYEEEYAKGGSTGKEYMVFNYTDDIYASNDVFKTKKEANDFIKSFRKRYEGQGYYRDSRMNKIDIEDIDLLAIPSDFNPYKKFAKGGSVGKIETGDLVNVIAENKSGVVTNVISMGKHFVIKFADGSQGVYDANELRKIDDSDDYAKGGEITYKMPEEKIYT